MSELTIYKTICCLSEDLLLFAKTGAWDEMITTEEKRRALIEQVKMLSENGRLTEKESGQKVDLIQRILSADTETKTWVEQRMILLQNGFKTERRLLKTYGSHALS
ncbi:hypothetical protein MNBD_NITROSPIRAE01-952 [hydrothermal vent metagenome]|uniref:Flagellar protein FliT n=1 Tax=hydrothermal vent metagenome TaxID=652676 RepID=A0A3B1D0Q7_9ZZZZ